jgi:hypothetical protein
VVRAVQHALVRLPRPLPVSLTGSAFTVEQAQAAGVGRRRTRSSDLAAPFRGIRSPGEWGDDLFALCRAYAVRMQDGQYFSHATAAALHGLPLPPRFRGIRSLDVTVSARESVPRMRGVIGHRARSTASVSLVRGLVVASAVDTWLQLGTVLTLDELIAVGDELVRRRNPLATTEQVHAAVDAAAGRRGIAVVRRALSEVRAGVDSPRETWLRLLIVRSGLPEPMVNLAIWGARGAFLAPGDLVFPGYRVLVEYDGEHHFATAEQARRDIDRAERLVEEGWRVLRFNRTHLADSVWIVAKVRSALIGAGWRP